MLNWLKNKLSPDDMTHTMEDRNGTGGQVCNNCGHIEDVLFFTHDFSTPWNVTVGYQCQSCAKFVTSDDEPGLNLRECVEKPRCECGGSYARDKPVMCSQCKSVDLGYTYWEMS